MKLKHFESMILLYFVASTVLATVLGLATLYVLDEVVEAPMAVSAIAAGFVWLIALLLFGIRHTHATLRPIKSMYQALQHVATAPADAPPPKPQAHGISKALVEEVIKDIYELSSGQHDAQSQLASGKEFAEALSELQSNAVLVIDREGRIAYANKAASKFAPGSIAELKGMSLTDAYQFEFSSGGSFDDWLQACQAEKIQARYIWERVRVANSDDSRRYFDMIADYSKNESHGMEVVVVLVDKTESYHGDDEQMGFVSLAVHELRSPISLLRGYIEVFDEELSPSLDESQRLFMQKMTVAAAQLSTFVNNILNVARIEQDQLKVHLHEDTVYDALNASKEDFSLRAEVRNRVLTYKIGDHIPTVGLDRVAFYEVLSNLVDNAIKYSHDGGEIIVSASASDSGGVAITVEDKGVGIPASSMDNLFERFYRSHHSRDLVSGTGLGLFLSKRLVEAHGGTIWVRSTPGEGSTFGIDLPTFESTKKQHVDEDPNSDNIVRSAHGWIKNHGKVRK